MNHRRLAISAAAAALMTAIAISPALAGDGIETAADFTPFHRFEPVTASSTCEAAPDPDQPFVLPPGYRQDVIAYEGQGGTADLWDMNTHNETGRGSGRYVYRSHEVGASAQVSVTDLWTGQTEVLAQQAHWERLDGIAWTEWGTILVAEETIRQSLPDPQVPHALGGLLYELYVDRHDPSELDPSREHIHDKPGTDVDGDGTIDTVRDGIRARPAVGAKSHEGIRFDRRDNLYGIAETRGQTTVGQSGGIFKFVPDHRGDLSRGQLYAFRGPGGASYGPGTWVALDRAAVRVDADAEAEAKGASQYERPEDVETGQSTGRDANNGGQTVYVAITEGAEAGVLAIDLGARNEPFAYAYVGPIAGNTPADFTNPDNLALDRRGNLVIAEDPPVNTVGADIWVAAAPRRGHGHDDDRGRRGNRHARAGDVARFASLTDCAAEPTGIYFSAENATSPRYIWDGSTFVQHGNVRITRETLFVNVQHAGATTALDRLVAITPVHHHGDDDDHEHRD